MRVGRRLFTFCSIVSLLLCVAVLIGWRTGVSQQRFGEYEFERRLFGGGGIYVFADLRVFGMGVLTPAFSDQSDVYALTSDQYFLQQPVGFGCVRWNTTHVGSSGIAYSSARLYRGVVMPGWFAVAIAAILPALTARQVIRRHSRRLHGSCLTCGYDLRSSLERCPECGRFTDGQKVTK